VRTRICVNHSHLQRIRHVEGRLDRLRRPSLRASATTPTIADGERTLGLAVQRHAL